MRDYQSDLREFNEWNAILDTYIKNKNILTESEFSRYEPLFHRQDRNNKSVEAFEQMSHLKELSNAFFDRINPYDEITIVSDSDHSKVVMVLPRPFMQLQELRADVAPAVTNFSEKMKIPYRGDLHAQATDNLMAAVAVSQDIYHNPDIKEQARKRYAELENRVLGNPQPEQAAAPAHTPAGTTQTKTTTNVDWAFDED